MSAGLRPVEARFGHEVEQRLRVADVASLRPVRVHESGVNRLVQAGVPRELGQLERAMGVRDDVRGRVVRVPAGLDHGLHLRTVLVAVACVQLGPCDALGRVFGVEVERKPFDRGAEPALEPRRPFEADVAERSDVVAPDVTTWRLSGMSEGYPPVARTTLGGR